MLLIAGADPVVDSARTQEFAALAPADKVTTRNYDDYLHEILNETPERSARAFDDIENSVVERFAQTGNYLRQEQPRIISAKKNTTSSL